MYIRLVLLVLLRLFASLMNENTDMFVILFFSSALYHSIAGWLFINTKTMNANIISHENTYLSFFFFAS